MSSDQKKIFEQPNEKMTLRYSWYKFAAYQIRFKSYLTLGKGKVNETEFTENWIVEPKEFNHLTLHTSPKEYIKFDHQLKDLYKVLGIIQKSITKLEIELNHDKTFRTVTNKEEIKQLWNEIKLKELKYYDLVNQNFHLLIEAHEQEIQNLDANIKNNIIFQFMFYPFPINDVGEIINSSIKQTLYSIFFPSYQIEYSTTYKIEKSNNSFQITVNGGSNESASIEDLYHKNYQQTLKQDLAYNFSVEGKYEYTKESVLDEANLFVQEKLNDDMLYVCQLQIKLIKNHKE